MNMVGHTFPVKSEIRGYHENKTVWDNPVDKEELDCEREIGYSHDL